MSTMPETSSTAILALGSQPPGYPDHITEILMENATDAGRHARPGWTHRADGWTPERIRTFLTVLAQRGVVAEAARAAGMSVRSAYALRTRAKGGAFDRAWRTARSDARDRRAERAMARTLARSLVPIIRDGKLWGIRHRLNNRFDMTTLTRLDRWAAAMGKEKDALESLDLDELIERACASCGTAPELTGGGGSGADGERDEWQPSIP